MQNKIILIFLLIGITLIGGLGIFCLVSLENIATQISAEQIENMGQVLEAIQRESVNIKVILIASIIMFVVAGIVIYKILSKFVIYPINKLIKSAEKITEEEIKEVNKGTKKRKKTEMKNLENVFGIMTTELKEKLSEVSTQKNQIETILLHMTDGIIAFNRQGEIILINPAAKKILEYKTRG